jgi:hypothetical protein
MYCRWAAGCAVDAEVVVSGRTHYPAAGPGQLAQWTPQSVSKKRVLATAAYYRTCCLVS